MSTPTVSAARTARIVGTLTPGRPAYRALADALRLAIADEHIAAGTRAAERARAHGIPRRQPHDRDPCVCRAARHRLPHLAPWLGVRGLAPLRQPGPRRRIALPRRPGRGCHRPHLRGHPGTRGRRRGLRASGVPAPRTPGRGRLPHPRHPRPGLRSSPTATPSGLPTSPDDVLVTSGAVAGIGIVLRALLGHGDRVVVESPTYPNTIDALRRSGARLVPLAIDPDGWDATESARTIRAAGASLAVLIPDFHNPTGALMGDDARATLAARSRHPRRSPSSTRRSSRSTSATRTRCRCPSPRTTRGRSVSAARRSRTGVACAPGGSGHRRAPPALVEARVTTDLGAPCSQLVLLELMRAHPGLSPQRRLDLRASRGALADALRTHLPQISFRMPRGELSLWCELPEDVDATSVAVAAEDAGLLVAAGPRFAVVGELDRAGSGCRSSCRPRSWWMPWLASPVPPSPRARPPCVRRGGCPSSQPAGRKRKRRPLVA